MKPEIIISILVVVAFTLFIFLAIRKRIIKNKVLANSKKIALLRELNTDIPFYQVQNMFHISKHYDNKSNYNKIEPAYLMASELREKIDFFSDYIFKIQENLKNEKLYAERIQEILGTEYPIDYKQLRISKRVYNHFEYALFQKLIIKPIVSSIFLVTMSYSSPKGKVNLSKTDSFTFEDMRVCFESVSRSHLDKSTYSKLAAVERGEISDSLRYDILNRDNFTCVICGASSKQGVRLHVDHIIPVSKGGKSIASNLRTLCERCNVGKSNKIETGFIKSDSSDNETNLICEKCGAELVLRKGKYGDFYGCSKYPTCTFTKKV